MHLGCCLLGVPLPALPESTLGWLARVGRDRGGAPTHRRTEQELEAEDSWGGSAITRVPGPATQDGDSQSGPMALGLWGLGGLLWR